jgi:protein SCO1/2
MRRHRAARAVGVTVLAVAALAACGSSSSHLNGLVRTNPLDVGAVTITDVTTGAPSPTLAMKAAPGRLLVVYFGYTHCPDVCPTTLADLKLALAAIGAKAGKVDTAFATVDPDRDTADVMNGYVANFVPHMHALRPASPTELQRAEDAFGASSTVTKAADGTVEVTHTAVTYVVDPAGHVILEWPFGVKRDAIAHDLRQLITT